MSVTVYKINVIFLAFGILGAIALDNPNYEGSLPDQVDIGRELENPLYSDVGPSSSASTDQPTGNAVYETVDQADLTNPYECLYDNRHNNNSINETQITNNNQVEINDEIETEVSVAATESNAPPSVGDIDSSNFYSELGPMYSQLEPHIQKSTPPIQVPPDEDGYSCLQHK